MKISLLNPTHLTVSAKLDSETLRAMRGFPGFTKWRGRDLIVRITGTNIAHLIQHWPDAEWVGDAAPIYQQAADRIKAESQALLLKDSTQIDDHSGHQFKRPPMDHQRKAFLLARDAPAYGLFMEQGTGKTKVVIDTAAYLHQRGLIKQLIVVAWPNGVHRNWVEYELPEDCPVPYVACWWTSNLTKRTVDRMEQAMHSPLLRVITFNVEALTTEKGQKWMLRWLDAGESLVVIDQSASIKNPQAARTKFLTKDVVRHPNAVRRMIMDGAPVAEGADELYSQFMFLDPLIIGHDTWTAFKREFCIINKWNGISGYRNLDELRRRIDPYSFRVTSEACQDLPERIYKRWAFDLTAEEKRIFNELRGKNAADFRAGAGDDEDIRSEKRLEVIGALIKNLRLQQVASGWWPEDGRVAPIADECGRWNALLDLIKGIGRDKAIIFSRFRADLDRICKGIGKRALPYHGGISEGQRAENKRAFLTSPEAQFIVGQPQALAIGHTLTAARHVIFYTNHHSLRLREEAEKRAHRTGQQFHVTIWDLVAKGTQDGSIIRALRDKKDIATEILRDEPSFFLIHENI